MKPFYKLVIYSVFLIFLSEGIFAQNFDLKLISKESKNQSILNNLEYKKRVSSIDSLNKELIVVLKKLKTKGFFTSRIINTKRKDSLFTVTIKLGKRVEQIIVKYDDRQRTILGKEVFEEKILVEKLEEFKSSISKTLLDNGIPFSEIEFKDYVFDGSNLSVNIKISESGKRVIQKTIFKNYESFPESFRKNYLHLNGKTVFKPEIIEAIDRQLGRLDFVEPTKSPEVLFKKDSTILYIYTKKKQSSNIDAMVNLSTDESNQVQFNGILDLTLSNILDYGENLQIFWNRVDDEQSEFRFSAQLPYVFQSKFSTQIDFNIYRQDSTFLNTTANILVSYPVNSDVNIGANIATISSSKIESSLNTLSVEDFNSVSFGLFTDLTSKRILFNNEPKLYQRISFDLRRRSTDISDTNQFQLSSNTISNFKLSSRSILQLKNQTQILLSNNYLQNELYRIGGINSVRGFDEQSIFTSKYSYLNTEYRLYFAKNFLYTISDFAWTENIRSSPQFLYALGAGYSFTKKNSQVNLAYVLGGRINDVVDLNNSRLLVKIVTFF